MTSMLNHVQIMTCSSSILHLFEITNLHNNHIYCSAFYIPSGMIWRTPPNWERMNSRDVDGEAIAVVR